MHNEIAGVVTVFPLERGNPCSDMLVWNARLG